MIPDDDKKPLLRKQKGLGFLPLRACFFCACKKLCTRPLLLHLIGAPCLSDRSSLGFFQVLLSVLCLFPLKLSTDITMRLAANLASLLFRAGYCVYF